MKRLLVIFFILYSSLIFAEENKPSKKYSSFTDAELRALEQKGEKVIIKQRDADTGLLLSDYTTDDDTTRISFLFQVNPDAESFMEGHTFEFVYAYKFDIAWLELFASRTNGRFSELTQNNSALGADSEELRDEQQSVDAFGGGISYRTRLIQTLVDSDKVFETTAASLGYYQMDESFRSDKFSGFGLKADLGVHRRSSRRMHYGMKMSYHLAHLKRQKSRQDEGSNERSLLLTWLTFGLDISFYF